MTQLFRAWGSTAPIIIALLLSSFSSVAMSGYPLLMAMSTHSIPDKILEDCHLSDTLAVASHQTDQSHKFHNMPSKHPSQCSDGCAVLCVATYTPLNHELSTQAAKLQQVSIAMYLSPHYSSEYPQSLYRPPRLSLS